MRVVAPPSDPATRPTEAEIMALLEGVVDPELGANIVELGMAKGARLTPDGTAVVTVALRHSLQQAAAAFLDEQAERLDIDIPRPGQ